MLGALWLVVFPAHGEDLWVPSPLCPMIGPTATCSWALDAQFSVRAGLVPEFRTASRDRAAGALGVTGVLGPVQVRARGDVLRDATDDGDIVVGPGDLRLGTAVATRFGPGFGAGLGWEVKLPDAADEGELGTDETDVILGGTFGWGNGPWWAQGALGIGILGNPLRFANQDDVPLLRAVGGWRAARAELTAGVDAALATARNPARSEAHVGAAYGGAFTVRLGTEIGLTPAAPDWGVSLGVGARFPFPVQDPLPEAPAGG